MKHIVRIGALTTLLLSSYNYATPSTPIYIAASAGLFKAEYDVAYRDQTDTIPQNISQSIQQHGYSESLAIGYSKLFANKYLIGAEFGGYLDSHNARYESGAATAAFSDNTLINHHFDLTFVPGLMLGGKTAGYIKLGLSYASLQDTLTSPAGFIPTNTRYSSNKSKLGFAGGLGLKTWLTDTVSVFVEGNYHDYGTVSFGNFQNFSATYTHNAHVYSYGALLGAAYQI